MLFLYIYIYSVVVVVGVLREREREGERDGREWWEYTSCITKCNTTKCGWWE